MTPMESFEAAVEELKKTLTAEEAAEVDNQFLDLQEGGEGTDEEKEASKKEFFAQVLGQDAWTAEDVKAFFVADTTDENNAAANDPGADPGDADDADDHDEEANDEGSDDTTTDDEDDDSQEAAATPPPPADPVTPPLVVPLRRRRSIGGAPTVNASHSGHQAQAAAATVSTPAEPEPQHQLSEAEMFEALRLAAEADAKLRADRAKMVPLTAAFKAHQKRMLDFAVAEKDKRDKETAKALKEAEKKDKEAKAKAKADAEAEKQRLRTEVQKHFGLTEKEYAGDFSETPVWNPITALLSPFVDFYNWARRICS